MGNQEKELRFKFADKFVLNTLYLTTMFVFIIGLLVAGFGFTMNASTNGEFGLIYVFYGLCIEPIAAFFMSLWFICKSLMHDTTSSNVEK